MRNNREHIYLMPGLGANSLIFEYLDFPKEKYSIHLLDWIMPIKNESIENYCSRFSKLIIHDDIILIGVSYGGMSEIPKRASAIENRLLNSEFSKNTFEKAVNLINKDFSPLDDMRASKNYRIAVAKNLLLKAFHEIKSKKTIRIN